MRILLSATYIFEWSLSKLVVKTAILQTEKAELYVYFIPPRESDDPGKSLWILITGSDGLVNLNAKYQVQSDESLIDLGFFKAPVVPQLFFILQDSLVLDIISKIVFICLLAARSFSLIH